MTKAELFERIIDCMTDEGRDDPEDYLNLKPIDLDYAKTMIDDFRTFEDECDLDDDERIAHLITPELMMEVNNCLIRAKKFEARVERLAEWIEDNEPVCEYVNYYRPVHPDAVEVYPTDFIWDEFPFDLIDDLSKHNPFMLIRIGKSSPDFRETDEYCWFEKEKFRLHSTNHPFRDGVLDAEAFARFIMLDKETFDYMFDGIIDDDDAEYILGCKREEYDNE